MFHRSLPLWFKIGTSLLLLYVVIAGFLLPVPRLAILNETIRNLYFHVPLWFGMVAMFLLSFIFSLLFLRKGKLEQDRTASQAIFTGTVFGILGLLTGMVWANFTWGTPWTNDPQLNGAAITMLIYVAYYILRNSVDDPYQRAKLSAVYAVFAFCIAIPLLFVWPRMAAGSLHPGKGGNPGFNSYDLDSTMRLVFYPAVIAFILLGLWITNLASRIQRLRN